MRTHFLELTKWFKNQNFRNQKVEKRAEQNRTCLLLLLLLLSWTESGKLRLLELVEPILLDIEPSNLWDNWCCWSAMDNAWRCNSSSVTSFLCDLAILLLLDPTSLESFFDIQMKRLPIDFSLLVVRKGRRWMNESVEELIVFLFGFGGFGVVSCWK